MGAAVAITAVLSVVNISAYAADRSDTVRHSRATVRDAPARLVLANAQRGDRVVRTAYCGSWVRVRVSTNRTMATRSGWVSRDSLTRSHRDGGLAGVPRDCAAVRRDENRWRDYIAAMNSPFHSYRYTGKGTPSRGETQALWRYVYFPTRIAPLSGEACVPSYNYRGDTVDPAQRIAGLDLTRPGYRYVTRSGAVALVAVPRAGGGRGNVWGFVPASCVQPATASGYSTVYFPRVVQLDRMPGKVDGKPRALRTAELSRYGCHAGLKSPTRPQFGWWPQPTEPRRCGY